MMQVVVRLRADETALSHDDARRREVLHPVAPLQLVAVTNPHLRLHLDKTLPSSDSLLVSQINARDFCFFFQSRELILFGKLLRSGVQYFSFIFNKLFNK